MSEAFNRPAASLQDVTDGEQRAVQKCLVFAAGGERTLTYVYEFIFMWNYLQLFLNQASCFKMILMHACMVQQVSVSDESSDMKKYNRNSPVQAKETHLQLKQVHLQQNH